MKFLKEKVWPVFLGLGVASIVMTVFEFTNSKFFPFPAGFDYNNQAQLLEFTKAQPNTLYILVMSGWFFGGLLGAYTVGRVSKVENKQSNLIILTVLLTILAVVNNFLILGGVSPWWVEVFGFLVFAVTSYLMFRYTR